MDPLGVSGAADEVADFGPQAGGRGRRLLCVIIASSAEGQYTLEGLVGPQETALVDGQGTGIVQNDTSILKQQKQITQRKQTQTHSCLNKSHSRFFYLVELMPNVNST